MRRNPGRRSRTISRAAVIKICAVIVAAIGLPLIIWHVSHHPTLPQASCGAAVTHRLDNSTQGLGADPGALRCFSAAARRCTSASIKVTEMGVDSGTKYVFTLGSRGPACQVTELRQEYGGVDWTGPVTSMACRLAAVTGSGVMLGCGGKDVLIPAGVNVVRPGPDLPLGPSAEQLAHGKWVSMPAAPFRLCDPISVWDGRGLVVVEPGVRANGWCPARAAIYDPQTNGWTAIAAPPDTIGHQVGAWGGGRLVLIAARNGKAITWSRTDGRWHQLPRVPNGGIPSITWTGREFLVIMIRGQHARAFMLNGDRWEQRPDLPQPGTGSIVEAAAAVSELAVYVLADVGHVAPPWGYVELLRLTASGWTRVPMSAGAPSSNFTLTTVAGGMVAAGSACPGKSHCTLDLENLALLRPGVDPDVIPLHTPPGVPAPVFIAAGGGAIVVANPRIQGFSAQPPTRECLIYDVNTGAWHRGPSTRHLLAGLGTHWTPYGVISLGQFGSGGIQSTRVGGWLLRSARRS